MEALASSPVPVALCLGGMDPSGGAGLLRDACTCQELGVHAMGVSLAETVQNGLGCRRVAPPRLDPAEQLAALSVHLTGAWGVKVGLCALEPEALQRLAQTLADLAPPVRIWDPILAPSLGAPFHDVQELLEMAGILLPMGGWVVAPNLLEAAKASGLPPEADPEALAGPFLARGARAVWLKGGHRGLPFVEDHWIDAAGARAVGRWLRLGGERRGTGCAVAAAWLCHRLLGEEGFPAAGSATAWIRDRWEPAMVPGGSGRPMFTPGEAR